MITRDLITKTVTLMSEVDTIQEAFVFIADFMEQYGEQVSFEVNPRWEYATLDEPDDEGNTVKITPYYGVICRSIEELPQATGEGDASWA